MHVILKPGDLIKAPKAPPHSLIVDGNSGRTHPLFTPFVISTQEPVSWSSAGG